MKLIARQGESEQEIEVVRHGSGYRVRLGDRWIEADLAPAGRYVHSLRLEDGRQHGLVQHREGNTHEISLNGATIYVDIIDPLSARRKQREDGAMHDGVIRALMPGRVVRVLVEPGDEVRRGAGLLILEAMKMENEIQAPSDGVIDEICVKPGQTVEGGAELVHIR